MNQHRRDYGGNNHHREELPQLDTKAIRFDELDANLFSTVAQETAKTIAANRNSNKSTQLRRFYDEIVMWDNKVMMYQNRFNEYLPFIRMLNAKVAYAYGRKLVDSNYTKLLSHCLTQVNTPEQMQTFKLFMEAFMGFYKVERPRD
jgi:CRISPR-associated protein Csm2